MLEACVPACTLADGGCWKRAYPACTLADGGHAGSVRTQRARLRMVGTLEACVPRSEFHISYSVFFLAYCEGLTLLWYVEDCRRGRITSDFMRYSF